MINYEQIAEQEHGISFVNKTKEIAKELGFFPNWLFAIMYQESRFKTNVFSQDGYKSVGLIQITDSNWRALFGITAEQASRLTALQHLDYIKKFYLPLKNKIKSFADLYVYNFGSAFINAPDSSIMATGTTAIYTCGKKDGVCTKGDFKNFVVQRYIKETGKHPDEKQENNIFSKIQNLLNLDKYSKTEKIIGLSIIFLILLIPFIRIK